LGTSRKHVDECEMQSFKNEWYLNKKCQQWKT
jgi:hypothetical protein